MSDDAPDPDVVDPRPRRQRFSLLTEPWVPAIEHSGRLREVGLIALFDNADDFVGLGGEMPTQEASMFRLLGAILQRAVDPGDDPIASWAQWWCDGGFPHAQVRAYLDKHADRFDLLHPEEPFFQVAGLHTASGRTSGIGKLIAELPDGEPFFTTRAPAETTRLSYAEAARWLIHAHAYDYSGIKSGAVGDDRVKGGKGYPIGTGFTGTLGLLLTEGRNLRETLLLNLVLTYWRQDDLVPWERPSLGPHADPAHTQPRGPADCATWQSRRIRLVHDGEGVSDVVLANGDALGQQNRQRVEPSSSWRYSEPQSKKFRDVVYMPLEHRLSRSVWRGLGATLGESNTQAASKAGTPAYERAGLLDWLSRLREDEVLDAAHPIVLRIVGMEYGAQNSSVSAVIDDRLVLPLDVIANPVVRQYAVDAVSATEDAVRALGRLGTNLADAAGRHLLPGMADGPRDRASEAAYNALDLPYRRWITLLVDTDPDTARHVWQCKVRDVVRGIAGDLVLAAGTPAVAGRVVNGRYLNTSIAENYFGGALRRCLPYAFSPDGH